jgi:uncharacterized protein YcnI
MSRSSRARLSTVALSAMACLALLAAPAAAHVTANPSQGPSGSYFFTEFSVGHGCDGSPTTAVSVQIPPGVVSVTPEVEPGWEIETVTGPYDEPVELHGEEITEGVVEVTWTGGPLPDERLTRFGLSMKLPEGDPGETLYFPVVQQCSDGETRWIQIPEEGGEEPDEPAPGIVLTAASGGHGDEAADADGEDSADAEPAANAGAAGDEAAADAGAADDPAATETGAGAADGAALVSAAEPVREGTDPLAVVALVVGALALVLGAVALMTRRRAA